MCIYTSIYVYMDQVLRVELEAFVCVVTEASYIGTVATANIWGVKKVEIFPFESLAGR